MKYHKGYAMGNLRSTSLADLVHSDERKKYVDNFNVQGCKSCWLRDKNQFIEYLIADSPQHVNFV